MSRVHLRRYGSAGLIVCVVGLAACGSSSDSDSDSGSGSADTATAASGSPGNGAAAAATARLAALYSGDDLKAPAGAALATQPGKDVWIISCGDVSESCSVPGAAAREAAAVAGWKVTPIDGKQDPVRWSAVIRQAVAARADGIVTIGIDCPIVKAALDDATKAGVPVSSINGTGCATVSKDGHPLHAPAVNFADGKDYTKFMQDWGASKADWLITKTGGKGKILDFYNTEFPILTAIEDGFARGIARCTSCKVTKIQVDAKDFGPVLQQQVQQALLKHPEATAIHIPFDGLVGAGVGAAIRASGHAKHIEVMGGEGLPSSLQLVINDTGEEDAVLEIPAGWLGWSAIDTLNSLLHGQAPRVSGLGYQLIDREHNLPSSGKAYAPSVDYRSAYRKLWGQG